MKFKLTSFLTGIGAGLLLGYFLYSLFPYANYLYWFLIIPTIIMAYFSYNHQVGSEIWAGVISIFILVVEIGNISGNGGFLNSSQIVINLAILSLGLILFNLFTGFVGYGIKGIKTKGRRMKRITFRTIGRS